MKRLIVMLAIALTAGTILSGCVVVPVGGWGWHGGGGYYHRPYYGGPYYRHW